MSGGAYYYRKAEQLRDQAAGWMDADHGWMASLSAEERLARRTADLADAQLCATLALAAATAESGGLAARGSSFELSTTGPSPWYRALHGEERTS